MAEVWRAEVAYSSDVSKIVALKMIREDLVRVPQFVSLFIDEARISSRISHANVAQVFDFGEAGDRPFLAMELVDGPDLETLMMAAREAQADLPLDICAHIIAEVSRGLAAAHTLADDTGRSYGVVHRDVSPQNVLISRAGEVKLTDFGIARARDKVTQTETGTVMGKFRYMSPEQVLGEDLDNRSDLFSCGILLFELITGTRLFDGRTSAEVVDQIRYQAIPDLTRHRPDVDPALDTVMRWTLERDPDNRCPDAATLARDLERYIHVAHSHFTRDDVTQLLDRLVPRAPIKKTRLAFAGTELASASEITEPPPGVPRKNTLAGTPDAPPVETTAPGKRATAAEPAASQPPDGAPASAMPASETEEFDGTWGPVAQSSSELRAATQAEAPARDTPTRDATGTLSKRPVRTVSEPDAPTEDLAERPTEALSRDSDVTAPTRVGDVNPSTEATLAETRTMDHRRDQRRPAKRRVARGLGSTFGVLLALALLGGVAWLILRPDDSAKRRQATSGVTDAGAQAMLRDDASPGDASPPSDAVQQRIAALDQLLDKAPLLRQPMKPAIQRILAAHIAGRLQRATVDATSAARLGPAAGIPQRPADRKHPLFTAALGIADMVAERVLLSRMVPPRIRALLRPLPTAVPADVCAPPHARPTTALHVLADPRSADAQEHHALQLGCRKAWRPPLAGQQGRRYLWPHLAVARDAVARLLELNPRHKRGKAFKRYLDAEPRSRVATLGELTIRLKSLARQALKKSDRQAVNITLALVNTSQSQPITVHPGSIRLHGAGPTPLAAGIWQPELTAPLPPGARIDLTLTFAAPASQHGYAWVLAVPRPTAGSLWIQAASDVLP